jgi:hypothetical protein
MTVSLAEADHEHVSSLKRNSMGTHVAHTSTELSYDRPGFRSRRIKATQFNEQETSLVRSDCCHIHEAANIEKRMNVFNNNALIANSKVDPEAVRATPGKARLGTTLRHLGRGQTLFTGRPMSNLM